jgi:hypothetical protein
LQSLGVQTANRKEAKSKEAGERDERGASRATRLAAPDADEEKKDGEGGGRRLMHGVY